ncbi:YggS family pyridoxal phosphate-dependent enzyme [Microbispora sp. ATCC PTA-5024]|uniref:YggS family pyridoxal phosphate-dependent enzyme n=1 Tax=Microbispora sp. ATCC PTA-5024 TaxID=316330 RepID=UPI0003DCDED0|nr:YggS family pyridoxal phosphate-dependent enzyme [Microbispora sp. ATCC PTA-5024]ETK36415.1 alanine racemase [Microbispora sp. ATCC PTA-5024]
MAEAPADRRREELSAALAAVERRVEDACRAAGRSRSEVTVIAVTKTYPASDVRLLAALGVTDIGENRDQEAAAKAAECAGLGLRWHFIGQLQTNKARQVAAFADVIHSIDRTRLVDALSREAVRAGREIGCLIQVSLADAPGAGSAGGPGGRGGAAPADVPALADAVARAEGLRLDGVMAVAPLGADPSEAFGRLRSVAERLREDHPSAGVISAGMSGDMAEAIANGATHLRVGTALLGRRTPFVR